MSFTNSYCSRDSARALRHGLLGALMAIGVAAHRWFGPSVTTTAETTGCS